MREDAINAIESAREMIRALCQPRGTEGSREWIMSIPARPDHDPDLVISAGLREAMIYIKELETERDRLQDSLSIAEAKLGLMREERDRLRELLQETEMFRTDASGFTRQFTEWWVRVRAALSAGDGK